MESNKQTATSDALRTVSAPRLARSVPQGRFAIAWALVWAAAGMAVAVGITVGTGADFGPALRLSLLFAEVVGFASLVSARVVFPRLANLPYLLFLPLQVLTLLSVTIFGSFAVAMTQPLFVASKATTAILIIIINAMLAVVTGIGLHTYDSMRRQIEEQFLALREKEAMERQMRIAREVQQQLLPREIPQLEGLELFGSCVPARAVGGDYFDFLPVSPDKVGLVIADVSGKGVPAALLVSAIQASVRSLSGPESSPSELQERVNDLMFLTSTAARYATFLLGFYDTTTRTFRFSSAGHHPPLRIRDGSIGSIPCRGGFPVGMFESATYHDDSVELRSGDLLVLYTDGMIECPDAGGEEFGEERLGQALCRHGGQPLDQIARAVMDEIAEWTGQSEAHDDATLVLARAR